jgi:hypothetical protein
LIPDIIRSRWNVPEVPPIMTQRASQSLVAALIRIGLLLALAIMLMAENAQAQALSSVAGRSRTGNHTSLRLPHVAGARSNFTA